MSEDRIMMGKKVCYGFLGGLLTLTVSKYIFNKFLKSNITRVLCIEIGGTSSRFAIFNVNKATKEIEMDNDIGFYKKMVFGPMDLIHAIQSMKYLYFCLIT